jgi:hypothetical protein
MQPEDEDHLRQLLKACDEMLTHHERTGNSETEPAKQIAAKRRELLNRLNQSPDTPSSGQATYTFLLTLANGEPADPAVFVSDRASYERGESFVARDGSRSRIVSKDAPPPARRRGLRGNLDRRAARLSGARSLSASRGSRRPARRRERPLTNEERPPESVIDTAFEELDATRPSTR